MTDALADPRFELTDVVVDGTRDGISCVLIVDNAVVAGVDVAAPVGTNGRWIFRDKTCAFVRGHQYGRITYLPVLAEVGDDGVFTDEALGATGDAVSIRPWLRGRGVSFEQVDGGWTMRFGGEVEFAVVRQPPAASWEATTCHHARLAHCATNSPRTAAAALFAAVTGSSRPRLPATLQARTMREALELVDSNVKLELQDRGTQSSVQVTVADVVEALWNIDDGDEVTLDDLGNGPVVAIP